MTLFEALVAAVVMGAGLLALTHAHLRLHGQAELARQRVQALHLAQRELEALRAAGTPAEPATAADGPFTLRRQVAELGGGLQAVSVAVDWTDRSGAAQALALHGLLAALDPSYAGALALTAPATMARPPAGRAAAAP